MVTGDEIRDWLAKMGLTYDQINFRNFLNRIEKESLKLLGMTYDELRKEIALSRESMVLNASRKIDFKNMRYDVVCNGNEIHYDHRSKLLVVIKDSDPYEYDSMVTVERYRFDVNKGIFEPAP